MKLSIVGDGGKLAEGDGVDGNRLFLGVGGRDWIAWITNWLLAFSSDTLTALRVGKGECLR